jgi:hypothetical protein
MGGASNSNSFLDNFTYSRTGGVGNIESKVISVINIYE